VRVFAEGRHLAPRQQRVFQEHKRPEARELVLHAAAINVDTAKRAPRAKLFAQSAGSWWGGCPAYAGDATHCQPPPALAPAARWLHESYLHCQQQRCGKSRLDTLAAMC
jgi:hypothetical protein